MSARHPRFLGTLGALVIATSAAAEDWPQILGPDRDGTVETERPLVPWGSDGPTELWRRPVGEGFAGPVIAGDRVLLFHRVDDREVLEAHRLSDGATLWKSGYPTAYRDDFGFDEGPRSPPTVNGGTVFTHGAEGRLTAFDLESGELRWQIDTHGRFDVTKGFFGAAGSPLVVGDLVLLNVGGPEAGIVAFARADGSVRWHATGDASSYSSGVVADLSRGSTALFFTRNGLVGLDPATGEIAFEFRWRARINASVNAATPLLVAPDRVFLSTSYGTGAVLLDVGGAEPTPVWQGDDSLTNHYATSVLAEEHLYGFHGRQEYRPALRCVEAESGEVAWSVDRFGAGSLLRVGSQLLVLHEDGRLLLAPATREGWQPLAESRILDGPARALPAYADGRLAARDARDLVVVELPRESSR